MQQKVQFLWDDVSNQFNYHQGIEEKNILYLTYMIINQLKSTENLFIIFKQKKVVNFRFDWENDRLNPTFERTQWLFTFEDTPFRD